MPTELLESLVDSRGSQADYTAELSGDLLLRDPIPHSDKLEIAWLSTQGPSQSGLCAPFPLLLYLKPRMVEVGVASSHYINLLCPQDLCAGCADLISDIPAGHR